MLVQVQVLSPALCSIRGCGDRRDPFSLREGQDWQQIGNRIAVALGTPMASLQQRNGTYRFIFRHHGRQHFVAIGKVSLEEAEAKAAQVEYLLLRLRQRLIELPPGVDIVAFLRFDGKPPGGDVAKTVARCLTLGK